MAAQQDVAGFSSSMIRDARLSISDDEFHKLRQLIHQHTGIWLADHKRALVCSRLAKRLRHWDMATYAEYYELLTRNDPEQIELLEMINAITTNKTEFFRESHHFQFLATKVLPGLQATHRRRMRMWCAGTSTGEEAYSLAITLCESFPSLLEWDTKILATDIDTNVLERARQGVYPLEQVRQIPNPLLGRYFLKGTGRNEGFVRVKPLLQAMIRFRRLNLIDETWPMQGPFDVIFCRNVLIYFDKTLQQRLLGRFARLLRPGGYLMLGHAEAIHGFETVFRPVGHSVYRHDTAA